MNKEASAFEPDDSATLVQIHKKSFRDFLGARAFNKVQQLESVPGGEQPTPKIETIPLDSKSSAKSFSSLRLNNAFIWAVIDDSPLNEQEHLDALAILEGVNPSTAFYKGQKWCDAGVDKVWDLCTWIDEDGRTRARWEWRDAIETVPSFDMPVAAALPSEATPRLTTMYSALFKKGHSGICTQIKPIELNQAYEAFIQNPEANEGTFLLTLALFARSPWRVSSVRRLISSNPEIAITLDDVFAELVLDLKTRLTRDSYQHKGNLDGFVAATWERFFLPSIKMDVIGYLKSILFTNNVYSKSPEYVFQKHSVNTEEIPADESNTPEPGYLCRRKVRGTAQIQTVRVTAQTLLSEIDNPSTGLGQMSQTSREMLKAVLRAETASEVANRVKISTQYARRQIKKAIVDAQKAMEQDFEHVPNSDHEQENIIDLRASAENNLCPFLNPEQAAAYLGGLNARTLTRWAREGYVPAFPLGEGKRRLWRFLEADLEA